MFRPFAETIPAVTVSDSPNGTAHGQHPVSDLHAFGIAQLGNRQRLVGLDLDHGQIGFLVGTDYLGVMQNSRRIIQQLHPDAIGFLDYVPVGHDVALGIDDDA